MKNLLVGNAFPFVVLMVFSFNTMADRAMVNRSASPIVEPGKLVAINVLKDKCYNKKPDGTLVKVKCPDVIVAKPSRSSGKTKPPTKMIARLARTKRFAYRKKLNKLGTVSLEGGTYNCYKEGPPGKFTRITCPDVIVLETN